MALSGVGSVGIVDSSGRLGIVVGSRTVGVTPEGNRLVSYSIRTTEEVQRNAAAVTIDPTTGEFSTPSAAPVSGETSAAIANITRRGSALPTSDQDLSERDQSALQALRQRDAQVRQEENAHAGAAGSIAGPPVYTYQRGPDGRMYAVGGSVSINAQTYTADPAEARALGSRINAAANAAINPSGADQRAASAGNSIAASGVGAYDQAKRYGELDSEGRFTTEV